MNFDANVVAPNGGNPITYIQNGPTATCVLVCHSKAHNPDGSVTTATVGRGPVVRR